MKFGRLDLRNPLLIASGPASCRIDQIRKAEDAGVAGISIKHVMSRQSAEGRLRCFSIPEEVLIFPSDKRLSVDEGLELIAKARECTDVAIIANFSSQEHDISSYGDLAEKYEQAGADALEINMCCPNFGLADASLGVDRVEPGALTGQNPDLAAAITRIVRDHVSIPVIPKLTPTALDIATVARACKQAGADALSLVGGPSLAAPPVDIYNRGKPSYPLMQKSTFGAITGSSIRYNTFKVVAQVAQSVSIPITASGGIDTWEHAVQMMMWGASSVGVCTAVMWRGFEAATDIVRGIERFMETQGYDSYEDFIGLSLEHLTGTASLEFTRGVAKVNVASCTSCAECLKPAHCDALILSDRHAAVIAERCVGCGVCESICRFGAISMVTSN